MRNLRWNAIVSLVVATVLMTVGTALGYPEGVIIDMNDNFNWKDADSSLLSVQTTMQMDEAVLWNAYDYGEVVWTGGGGSGFFWAYLYCYGARDGYTNSVQLLVDGDSKGSNTCTLNDYGVESWRVYIDYTTSDITFKFKLASGFLKYGKNPSWSYAVIKIVSPPPSSETRYWHMTSIEFNKVDSCAELGSNCAELHSEVSNHIVFLDDLAYMKQAEPLPTDMDPFDDWDWVYIDLYAKCLTQTCQADLSVNGVKVSTDFQWDEGYWTYIRFVPDDEPDPGWPWIYLDDWDKLFEFVDDMWIQIDNDANSEFLWTHVLMTEMYPEW